MIDTAMSMWHSTRHCNEQHNEEYMHNSVLVNFMHTWNYRDSRDNK